ncbi:MAG: hypothetical protein SGPRY_003512 [Prymnesium sp.]
MVDTTITFVGNIVKSGDFVLFVPAPVGECTPVSDIVDEQRSGTLTTQNSTIVTLFGGITYNLRTDDDTPWLAVTGKSIEAEAEDRLVFLEAGIESCVGAGSSLPSEDTGNQVTMLIAIIVAIALSTIAIVGLLLRARRRRTRLHLEMMKRFDSNESMRTQFQETLRSESEVRHQKLQEALQVNGEQSSIILHNVRSIGYSNAAALSSLASSQDEQLKKLFLAQRAMRDAQVELCRAFESHTRMLTTLLQGEYDCPKWVVLLPNEPTNSLASWVDPAKWVNTELKMIFICPVSMYKAGTGYKIQVHKNWVKRYGPALRLGLDMIS